MGTYVKPTFYEILEVAPNASQKAIHEAYQQQLRSGRYPDGRISTIKMSPFTHRTFETEKIDFAYNVLRNVAKRQRYDAELRGRAERGVEDMSMPYLHKIEPWSWRHVLQDIEPRHPWVNVLTGALRFDYSGRPEQRGERVQSHTQVPNFEGFSDYSLRFLAVDGGEYKHTEQQDERPAGSYPTIPGTLNGIKVAPFGDYGASHNCISQDFARRNGFDIDLNDTKPIKLANSKLADIVGTVNLKFAFPGDIVAYSLPFKVLPDCIHDVILSGHFLRHTETFTRFTSRIVWKCGSLFRRWVNFIGEENASQQYIHGQFDGEAVTAIPDTGSQVMLVSEDYINKRGHHVLRESEHRIKLKLGDGSIAYTEGMVQDVVWNFGQHSKTHRCDFYVLKDLPCDVILSCDFLYDTQAFQVFSHLLFDSTLMATTLT